LPSHKEITHQTVDDTQVYVYDIAHSLLVCRTIYD